MTQYLQLAIAVVAVGIPVLVVLFVPFVAVVYRSGRRPALVGILAASAAVVYVLGLWAYTVFPPPSQDPCTGPQVTPQLRPLEFLRQVRSPGDPLSWAGDPAVTTTALNVVLFVPLGVGVAVVLGRRRPLATAALVGLAVSLTVELVQLTGTLGLYDCAYRLFDVDDLITNTVGAVLGAAAVPLAAVRRRQRTRAAVERVTGCRRLLGVTIDAFAVLAVALTIILTTTLAADLSGPRSVADRLAGSGALLTTLALGLPAVALLVVLPLRTGGLTPGRWTVLLRPVDGHGEPPGRGRLLAAVAAGSGGTGAAYVVAVTTGAVPLQVLVGAWLLAGLVLLAVGDHRGLSGRVAGLRLADARSADRRQGVPDWTTQVDPDTALRVVAVALAAAYVVLVGSLWLLSSLGRGAPVALVPVVGTLVASQVVASGFLVHNGLSMVRRESRSVGNMLSLLAGLGSGLLVVLVVVVLLVAPAPVRLPVAVLSVLASYASALFVGFVLLGRRYGHAPLRGEVGAVVVLGSRVIGRRVPPLLAARLSAARDVRDEVVAAGGDPLLVPSGGQGRGEEVSEGEAMAAWLTGAGVPASAVVPETRARTTRENVEFSLALLEHARPGVDLGRPVLVTNGYHVLRAATIAKDLGIEVSLRAAPTSSYFLPSALLREYVAVVLRSAALHAGLAVALTSVTVAALLG